MEITATELQRYTDNYKTNDANKKKTLQRVSVGKVFTQTSRYAFSNTQVQREVSVQEWDTILVDNVSGCDAPEMAQSSLLGRV